MRLLLIVMDQRRAHIDRLYDEIAQRCGVCDVRRLTPEQQANLERYFAKNVKLDDYDRVAFMIRFKKIKKQTRFLRTIDNLVFIEFDACQNYMQVKNAGEFSRLYHSVPWSRQIVTGYVVAEKLRAEGLDAVFAPKGFDHVFLHNLGRERRVELGFVGSTNNSIYTERVRLLDDIGRHENVDRDFVTEPERYLDKLNDIRFFLTPDKGFGEYMLKNFEAMACGCVLVTYDQGERENAAIGFRDMENVVLFTSVDELRDKLARLRADPQLVMRIAAAGETMARENFTFARWAQRVVDALQPPLRQRPTGRSVLQRLHGMLRRVLSV